MGAECYKPQMFRNKTVNYDSAYEKQYRKSIPGVKLIEQYYLAHATELGWAYFNSINTQCSARQNLF